MDTKDILEVVGFFVTVAGIVIGYVRSRSDNRTAMAVEAARMSDRLDAMDARIDQAHEKAEKVQAGMEAGFDRLRSTLDGFAGVLTQVKEKVAVLVDRDERPGPRQSRARSKTSA